MGYESIAHEAEGSVFCYRTEQICSIKQMNILWGLTCIEWILSLLL